MKETTSRTIVTVAKLILAGWAIHCLTRPLNWCK